MGLNVESMLKYMKIPSYTNEEILELEVTDVLVRSKDDNILYYKPEGSPDFIALDTGQKLTPAGFGLGDAGTYLESFETNLGDWTTENAEIVRTQFTTPSSNTGPNVAFDGSFYVYFETSGSPSVEVFLATSAYKKLTTVNFACHMNGAAIADLVLQAQPSRNVDVWEDLLTISTQAQTTTNKAGITFVKTGAATQPTEGSPWSEYSVTIPPSQLAETIRFKMTYGGTFTGDIALDQIEIISVES